MLYPEYIVGFYHSPRLHQALGYWSSEEFKQRIGEERTHSPSEQNAHLLNTLPPQLLAYFGIPLESPVH